MPHTRSTSTIEFTLPDGVPDLTPDAARVLLRILRKAHDAALAASATTDRGNERDVA